MQDQLKNLFETAVSETGADLKEGADVVAAYAAQRVALLATMIGLPGYEQAVIVERDNVALFAGLHASSVSDAARERLLGVIHGSLVLGAQSLVDSSTQDEEGL